MPYCTFSNSNQCCPWMERYRCSERPSSSVWVAVEVNVVGVSQFHKKSDPLTDSSVCTAKDRSHRGQCDAAGLQNKSLGGSGRQSPGPGLSGRLLPELPVFTAALLGSTSHSPLLRRPAAGTAGWAVVLIHSQRCSSSRDISARA